MLGQSPSQGRDDVRKSRECGERSSEPISRLATPKIGGSAVRAAASRTSIHIRPNMATFVQQHLHREIEKLKTKLLSLGTDVEENVYKAVKALDERNGPLADQVISADGQVDRFEVYLEEECLKILALHQPVAIDLRFVIAVLKINNDLERIGDLAVNIAERAKYLSSHDAMDVPFDFMSMADKTRGMLKKALDALVNMDPRMARDVCASDDEVDGLNREMYGRIQKSMEQHPDRIEGLIHYLGVSRYLERIADHATNIAEDVIFMVSARDVRHHASEGQPSH
jgi:phosphate transport system protein